MCNARSGGSGRKMTTSGPISGVSVGSNSSGGQSAIASEWFSWFAQHRNLGKKGQHTQVGWQTFIFISSSLVEKWVWKKKSTKKDIITSLALPNSFVHALWSRKSCQSIACAGPKGWPPTRWVVSKTVDTPCVLEQRAQMHEELT